MENCTLNDMNITTMTQPLSWIICLLIVCLMFADVFLLYVFHCPKKMMSYLWLTFCTSFKINWNWSDPKSIFYCILFLVVMSDWPISFVSDFIRREIGEFRLDVDTGSSIHCVYWPPVMTLIFWKAQLLLISNHGGGTRD